MNSSAYTSAVSVPYTANTSYHFRIVVDFQNHTYSAYVTPQGGTETQIGRNYAIRNTQSTITSLSYLSSNSSVASTSICNLLIGNSVTTPTAATITATGGTPQSATVNTDFASPLAATVKDTSNNPVSGATVTFAAPGSGASGTFSGGTTTATAVTDASGIGVSPAFTANGTAGSYTVTASVSGVSTPANFNLTNANGTTPTCTVSSTSWQSQTFITQTGSFSAAFDATPLTANTDSVIGLSAGIAGQYTDLAAIVRFNTSGFIDVMNSLAYTSVTIFPYTANTSYHFRAVVDIQNHTYSVYVTPQGGTETQIANNYAFRNTQSTVTTLSYLSSYSDVAQTSICNLLAGNSVTTATAATITATGGTPQSGTVNTAFASPLAATVNDVSNNPVSGATVTFTAPGGGASGTFSGGTTTATAVTDASGIGVSPAFTANGTAGSYIVTATVSGVGTPANFSLTNTAGASFCTVSSTSWQSLIFVPQTGWFTVAFDATPLTANTDSVIGLSAGVAGQYTELAAIVRFNTSGSIDVMNSSAYTSDASFPYTANTPYHVRAVVSVQNHTYSVYVSQGGTETQIASNYAFRNTQSTITSLSYLSSKSSAGATSICNPLTMN
jgi:hypothetical protein